jgi:outer membrane lipoprotein SlyB
MKKLIATIVCLVVLSMSALPAAAQRRARWSNRQVYNTQYDNRYDNNVYRNDDYVYGRNRSVWDQHRDKITTAGGAVGGALLGGLIGGKKGAIIGAITGGAGAAVYTYKVRDRYRRF